MSEREIVVYGTPGCSDTRWSRKYFEQQSVPYRWVDINKDSVGLKYVREVNGGERTVPTIVFADGSILVEPSNAELASKLGLAQKLTGIRLTLSTMIRLFRWPVTRLRGN